MRSFRPLIVAPFWLAAVACLAVPMIDGSLNWVEANPKRWFVLALFAGALLAALWAAKHLSSGPLRFLPFAVLLAALANDGYQRSVRQRYLASPPERSVGVGASVWRPVTTMDLVRHFYVIPSSALAVDRLRVVQISDLHVTPALPKSYYEAAFDSVVAQNPDVILLTGDYVSRVRNLPLLAQLLSGRLHARFGVFAVLGNHDWWTAPEAERQILNAAGITLVTGGCEHLPESVGRVAVCGTEEPWGPKLETLLPSSDLSLVLSHTPDNVYDLAALGASAVFSGHLHGGQVRIPGYGALVTPSRYGQRFDQGHFRVGATDLFVSAGLGADSPPLRIYCRPDIVIVDFINSQTTAHSP
jgi:predicted MPP superfamily phosphohydrolase